MSNKLTYYVELGKAIASARENCNMSQEELALLVGLKRTSISNIEHARQDVSAFLLHKIAQALHVEPITLIPLDKSNAISVDVMIRRKNIAKMKHVLSLVEKLKVFAMEELQELETIL